MFKTFKSLFIFLLTTSMSFAGSPPVPQSSEYLTTEAGDFLMVRDEGVRYTMSFSLNKALAAPLYATISFENPVDRTAPLTIHATLEPGQLKLLADSPNIPRIANGNTYKVEVRLYADGARTKLVSSHEQQLVFYIPKEIAESFGIKLL